MDKEVINCECLPQSMLKEDAAEYLQITLDELDKLLKDATSKNAQEWNNKTCIDDFYKNNRTQFLDLISFHYLQFYWNDRMSAFANARGFNILDFGCGIGTASFYLAQNRNHVIGYDPNEIMIDFCNFRGKKFGFSYLSFTNEFPDLKDINFIVTVDVFEHIENLRETLLKLGQVATGTKLYHVDVFENHPDHHPMHFDHSKEIEGWLKEAGFLVFDKRWAIKGG